VRAEVLLRAAVMNNAGWCDAVCRSHGYPGEFTARTWISTRHDLPFYPNAITLSPEATAVDTQATRAPGRAYAVKDSLLGCYRDGVLAGGAIAYTAAQVTGISNVFKTGLPDGLLWPSAVRAVAALRPGLPVVGYESGEDLAAAREAGGRVLGPLRIWTRGSAVP